MANLNPYLEGIEEPSSTSQADANINIYLDMLNKAEGSPDSNTIVGGKKFNDLSKHPGIVGLVTQEGPSTAAGKWQITKSTYDTIAPKIGVTDFTEPSQKKIAIKLIEDNNALEDVKKGDWNSANAKLGKVWASLPSSTYSQPKRSTEWVEGNLKATMAADNAEHKADEAQPSQVLDRLSPPSNPYLEGIDTEKTNPYLEGVEPVKAKPISKTRSFSKAFAASAAKGIAASPAMAAGAELGVEAGLLTGPGAPVAAPVLGLAGGIGGYLLGQKGVEKLYNKYVPESIKKATGYDEATRQAEIKANPETSYTGELLGNLALFRPGKLADLTLPGGKVISPLAQRATLGGVSGGIEAGSELVSGEPLNPLHIAEATAFGAAATKPTTVSRHADKLASNIISKIPGTSKYTPTVRTTEQPATDTNVPPQERTPEQADLFQSELDQANDIARRGQVFEPTETQRSNIDALLKTQGELELNKIDATKTRNDIETEIPDAHNREQITMAIEGERSYDKLYTDQEKAEELLKMQRSIAKQQNMVNQMQNQPLNVLLRDPRFRRDYTRLANKEGFPVAGTPEQKINFIRNNIEKVSFAHENLRSSPSDQPSFSVKERIVREFQRMGQQARQEGLFPNLRRDYVTHALDFTDSVLNREQQRSLSDYLYRNTSEPRFVRDFSQARQFRYIRDLETALRTAGDQLGIDVRGVKVQRDIAKIMEIYKNSMGKAIIEKKLVNYLLKTKMDGSPFTGREGELPILTSDRELAFRNNYVKFTGKGSEMLGDVSVHPDFVDPLGYVFRQEDPGLMLEAFKSVSMLSKFLNTVGSLFHATSLFVARSTAAPGAMIKEIFTAGAGTRMALRELEHAGAGEQTKLLIKGGLKAGTEDVQRTVIGDIAGTIDGLVNKYVTGNNTKIARRVSDPLEQHFLNHINRFTWDYMHSAGKLHLAQHFFTQIKSRHPELADDKIAQEVASFVNNTLGGLNWLQVANEVENQFLKGFAMKAMKLQNREWAQIVLFAPDWTLSTIRSFTRALPKELTKPQNWQLREGIKGVFDPKTSNDLARRYVLTTAALWLTILNGFNYAFTGRPIWTNRDPTRVDLGDGTSMQMAKHSMEAAEWLRDPEKTLGNKLGFIPKAVITMTTGKQYPSPNAPMVKDNTVVGRAVHSLKAALPFQYSAAMNAPPGEKLKRAAASFFGTPIYGQTNKLHTTPDVKMERKMKRKETQLENKIRKIESK